MYLLLDFHVWRNLRLKTVHVLGYGAVSTMDKRDIVSCHIKTGVTRELDWRPGSHRQHVHRGNW